MKLLEKHEIIENGVIGASKKRIYEDFAPHRHDFFEIEYIVCGSGTYMINGREYPIVPGRVFFMTPADFHAVYTKDTQLVNVMFSGELVENKSLFSLVLGKTSAELCPCGNDALLLGLLSDEIVKAVNEENQGAAVDFLTCFLRKITGLGEYKADESTLYIKKAVLYILEGFTRRITLEDTARHLGLSKNYLSEMFSREMGMGFKEYVDNLRFDYVTRLLTYSEIGVMEAYEKSGFSDYANFSRRFKQRYKTSPTKYRQKLTTHDTGLDKYGQT